MTMPLEIRTVKQSADLALVLTDYRIPRGKIRPIAEWLGVGESSLYRYLTAKPPSKAVVSRMYNHRGIPPALWELPPEALQASLYLLYIDTKEPKTISLSDIF